MQIKPRPKNTDRLITEFRPITCCIALREK